MSATETSYNQDLVLVMQARAVRHLTITDTSNLGSNIYDNGHRLSCLL
jgi:hypothetical protein